MAGLRAGDGERPPGEGRAAVEVGGAGLTVQIAWVCGYRAESSATRFHAAPSL